MFIRESCGIETYSEVRAKLFGLLHEVVDFVRSTGTMVTSRLSVRCEINFTPDSSIKLLKICCLARPDI